MPARPWSPWGAHCSDYAPVVNCLDRDPSSYGGYEIALFQVGRRRWPERGRPVRALSLLTRCCEHP